MQQVSKFKLSASKAGTRACSKSPKFCLDYFSLSIEGIVLIFMICSKLMYSFAILTGLFLTNH